MVAIALAGFALLIDPASALTATSSAFQQQLKQDKPVTEAVFRRADAPPAPGCWSYTDPSKTQGLRDVCP